MSELELLRKENAALKKKVAYYTQPRVDKTKVYLLFVLTMPNAPTWNGKCTGDDKFLGRVVKLRKTKKNMEKVAICAGQTYSYKWEEGWRASVEVKRVSAAQAKKATSRTSGFAGYGWMIDSILEKGKIETI